MATYTSNLNLYMPDPTDDFGEFREEHNDNMVKIDNAIGGGGGSGGHTIVNENGTDMPAEGKLQFTGGVTVTDDSVNGKTVVDISGGGGNVYGAFIDTNRIITSGNIPQGSSTYTATEDCALLFTILSNSNNSAKIEIDGVKAWEQYDQNGINSFANLLLVKRGQTVTFTQSYSSNGNYTVYGLQQGTNQVGVHYSTSEQVIGTWIDGKPIYQRTWDFSASPVMLSYANWVNSGIPAGENIKSIISAELKYGVVTNMAVEVAVGADGYPVAFQKVENAGNTRGVEYCTLRYTKTTD